MTSHPDITITEFFGGLARGSCVQLNSADRLAESDSIQLTRLQAEAVVLALLDWLNPEPAPLTEAQLARLHEHRKRVFGRQS